MGDQAVIEIPTDGKPATLQIGSSIFRLPAYDPDQEVMPKLEESERIQKTIGDSFQNGSKGHMEVVLQESSMKSKGHRRSVIEIPRSAPAERMGEALVRAARDIKGSPLLPANLMRAIGLKEADPFATDVTALGNIFTSNPEQEFLQIIGGPFSKNLYLGERLQQNARSWWEYNHNPIAWALVNIMADFVFGRGVKFKAKDERFQKFWDDWYREDHGWLKCRTAFMDRSWQGNLIARVFLVDGKPTLRLIDAATMLEKITDPEDSERVYGWWQGFPGVPNYYTLPAKDGPVPPATYTIKIIPPDEVIHWKHNFSSGEKFGRSDFKATLGWMKRDRDLLNAQATSAQFESMFAWDVSIEGSQDDVTNFANDPTQQKIPTPGSAWVHNKRMVVTPMSAKIARGSGHNEVELDVIKHIAAGYGMPVEFLGYGEGGTKAIAITATTPWAKHVETLQMSGQEEFLVPLANLLCIAAKIAGTLPVDSISEGEFTFPEPAPEDVDLRIKRYAFMEDRKYESKEDTAIKIAGEVNDTTYNYADQQTKIRKEQADAAARGDAVLNRNAKNRADLGPGGGKPDAMGGEDKSRFGTTGAKLSPTAPVEPEPDLDPTAP
jgi:hypothetical protein